MGKPDPAFGIFFRRERFKQNDQNSYANSPQHSGEQYSAKGLLFITVAYLLWLLNK